jgi:hypothetical protein
MKTEKQSCGCGQAKEAQKEECSCGGPVKEIVKFKETGSRWMINIAGESIPLVPAKLTATDIIGNFLARFGINRMDHAVRPGLYAVGRPGKTAPVLVSANYKMSFDALRKELSGIDAWILVLDTKGVNVWCAAGKGTFGTQELIKRILTVKLDKIVTHKNLIVPQLGAPGIETHLVMKHSGFRVIYGPVEACDIEEFLKNGMNAGEKERTVGFGLWKRLEITGIEFVSAVEIAAIVSLIAVLAASFTKNGFNVISGISNASYFIGAMFVAVFFSTIIPAALMPYLPGRMFSVKGAISGFAGSVIFVLLAGGMTRLTQAAVIVLSTTLASFVFMNYTGTTTFTSLTGVRREIEISAPVMIMGAVIGTGLQITDFIMKGAIKWN